MYFKLPFTVISILVILIAVLFLQKKYLPEGTRTDYETTEISIDSVLSVQTIIDGIRPGKIRTHLEFLADDLLEGRDTGSRGAMIAGMYIEKQFREYGLLPAIGDSSYFQEIQFLSSRVKPATKLSIEVDNEMVPLRYADDVLIGVVSRGNEIKFSSAMVYAGFGITAPEYNYDDYKDIDVHNKFVVALSGEPESDDVSFFEAGLRSRYSSARRKRKTARENGAAGIIHLLRPQYLERISWDKLSGWLGKSKISLADSPEMNADGGFVEMFMNKDMGELLFSGTGVAFSEVVSQAEIAEAQAFDMGKLISGSVAVEQTIMPDRNVIGILPGSDPDFKHEVMVFTAHFDHIGIGKAVDGDSIYNGATDNASGTAGLLALAEAFGNLPVQPKRSLLFMGLTGEERGLLGAYFYTANPIIDLKNTVACINFDMIGVGDDSGIISYGGERSSLGEIMAVALEQVGLTSIPDPVPEERIFQRSDHYAFVEKGIPSILTGYGVDREMFKRHLKYYHQPGDDAGRAFDYEYIQHHIAAVVLAGWQIANAPDPPSWTEGDPLSRVRTETE